jgi:MoaA/NifB/PqqE/SkfB family radical SAM enzyme
MWHWHIEISSKCTLRCPRCSRSEVPAGLINTELDLEFFQKNFPPEFIKDNVRKITFCGDDGDPIYAHDLVEVIRYFKRAYPVEFVIITNGSYKSEDWWKYLAESLTDRDEIHFSIDGWDQASNEQYRVNSNYESIMLGVRTMRKHTEARMTWAAIAFEFNQDHLARMQHQASELGFDFFQLTRSTKFGKIYPSYGTEDALQPRDEFISGTMRFDRQIRPLSGRPRKPVPLVNDLLWKHAQNTNTNSDIIPLCAIGNKGLFINSQGDFFPCCWVANRYSHNQEWLERGRQFNLVRNTLADVIRDTFWKQEFQSYRWLECQTKCKRDKVDHEYATSW